MSSLAQEESRSIFRKRHMLIYKLYMQGKTQTPYMEFPALQEYS
jgi:hypothetical protein